jgi:hypothetical protein
VVASRGRLSWGETRTILEQLADDLASAAGDGTLPPHLTVDQIWLRGNGEALLLDVALGADATTTKLPSEAPVTEERLLGFLGEVAGLALEGVPRPACAPPARSRAPLPEHATQLLARLLGPQPPFERLDQLQAALAATRDRPTEVTRARRLAHLAVLGAFLTPGLSCMYAGVSMSVTQPLQSLALHDWILEQAADDLHEGAWLEWAMTASNPNPGTQVQALAQLDADLSLVEALQRKRHALTREVAARLHALTWPWQKWAQEQVNSFRQALQQVSRRRDQGPNTSWQTIASRRQVAQERARDPVAGSLPLWLFPCFIVFWPLLWVPWAFAWRGGLSFRLLGLSLVRADGRRAARRQCAVRTLLVWAPVTCLLVLSVWLYGWGWSTWEMEGPPASVQWVILAAGWGGGLLVPLYAVLAVWQPTRGLHDRLAGTYLVPR